MDWLTRNPPSDVEVGGKSVPIRTGWRRSLRSLLIDDSGDNAKLGLLMSWYSHDGTLPDVVCQHSKDALNAALDWRDHAFEMASPWGKHGRATAAHARLWSWEDDAPLVAADFLRLYGIDLWSQDTQLHWYRFVALWSACLRTQGSLCAEAVSVRAPLPTKADKYQRQQHDEALAIWSLPLTQDEIREALVKEW